MTYTKKRKSHPPAALKTVRDRPGAAVLIVTILFASGCVTGPPVAPVERLTAAGLDEPFPDGSMALWKALADRLPDDIDRALDDLDWAKLFADRASTGAGGGVIVRAGALLDDGRTATVVAWPDRQDRVGVAVRVGRFGDRRQEQRFVNALAKRLSGKPKRRRGGGFELP